MVDSKSLTRKLYYSDNLPVLQDMEDESVDLIYLDPPFNSNRAYNIIYPNDLGQITAFEDTWSWTPECDVHLSNMNHLEAKNILGALVNAMGKVQMCAYMVNMAVRLIEMKRVLTKNGSLYLHCDQTACHYLKIVMDSIFGRENFQNEIIWHYQTGGGSPKRYTKKHDILLLYSKQARFNFYSHAVLMPRTPEVLRRIRSGVEGATRATDESKLPMDVWVDIQALNAMAKERLGYPTQKPLALLERILMASSKEGDLVLDPFCGCGTTVAAAEKLKRRWIGIDITYSSIAAIKERFKRQKLNIWGEIQVLGEPETVNQIETNLIRKESARARKEFEKWCVTRVGGMPNDKMGADGGIDGRIPISNNEIAIISVKSGNVSVKEVRELKGLLNGKNKIGIFITKEKPKKPMVEFAKQSGIYEFGETLVVARAPNVPRIQILTLEQILRGEQPVLP